MCSIGENVEERKEIANLFSELSHAAIGEMTLKLSPDQKRILNIAAGAITFYIRLILESKNR